MKSALEFWGFQSTFSFVSSKGLKTEKKSSWQSERCFDLIPSCSLFIRFKKVLKNITQYDEQTVYGPQVHHGNSCPPSAFPSRLHKMESPFHSVRSARLMACFSTAIFKVVTTSPSSLKQPCHHILMVQPRCSRSLQISNFDSKAERGPCDTCTVTRLCTLSAAFLCSPVSAGPPSSAPSPSRHWRTDHAARLEENDKSKKYIYISL